MHVAEESSVLFFDIDGTIVWRDHEAEKRGEYVPRFDKIAPSQGVYNAFKTLRGNGHYTFICTGRAFCQIPQSLLDLNPSGFLVEAGSHIKIGDTVIKDSVIPRDVLEKTVYEFEALKIDAEFESNQGLLGFYPSGGNPRFPDYPVANNSKSFLELASNMAIAKFCVHDYSLVPLKPFAEFAQNWFSMCDLTHDVMEFTLIGCNKGSAIRQVLDYLGHGVSGTFAFGDSENDLPMAESVERFIAMGNALEQVKERAAYVTLPVWDDGVPHALKQLGLI